MNSARKLLKHCHVVCGMYALVYYALVGDLAVHRRRANEMARTGRWRQSKQI